MITLRLTQFTEAENKYRVEVALEGDGLARQTATSRFDFKLTPQDHEDLRWYLEDFLQYPLDPAPTIAARIEQRMAEIGKELFNSVFQSSDDACDLWATLRTKLANTRVEISTGVAEASAIPWELLRDPKTDAALALRAQAFVHSQPQAAQRPHLPAISSGPIRILLVICRPGGRDDVPFRSVATRLLKGLSATDTDAFQLDVLRPPSFEQLSKTLRQAKANGAPYHVVHFDGHGDFFDMKKLIANWKDKTEEEIMQLLASLVDFDPNRFSPQAIYPQTPREGRRGYLAFENSKNVHNLRFVDGQEFGKLLVETEVSVLMLNSCRSAYAEALPAPLTTDVDPHTQVRVFGSLTQEIMDAGATGVVAMRYTVYVVTAAEFVASLYESLTKGHSLGEAVTLGRKQLAADPNRSIAYDQRPLQDWPVPVVYEAAPIALFPKPKKTKKLNVKMTAGAAATGRGSLAPNLPAQPDAGFYGRDETLLALDRAFDRHAIVLLHAFAGSGKTAAAAEFARWYSLTGGVLGPVLFTSFEQYLPLPRVLDQIGQVFGPALEQTGVHWLAMSDADRRTVAVQVLKQIPVLWLWDNVESVAGFPAGTTSAWSAAEQKELKDFLVACRDTKAKVLLTSRRDEQTWLGDLAVRIHLPAMPMQERVQLARALAEKHNRHLTEVADWRPLLRFTQGNPLTITILVGQALREGLKTKEQIIAFVEKLRAGEANFSDEASEGRAKSLGASLSYGFENAFNETERKQLALLYFFQGFVDVGTLQAMGHPEIGNLSEVRGLTREAGIALLDRAAEVGLLTAFGGGYYSIHPALPWYFKKLFDQYYPPQSEIRGEHSRTIPNPQLPARAFVDALGELGNYYHNKYNDGNREMISLLTAEEANLLHARRLARKNGWWHPLITAMQGLRSLYDQTGRRAEWKRLVEEILPDFLDTNTEGPLSGKEEQWGLITEYRVQLAQEARQWQEAERLQQTLVKWSRQSAAPVLALPMKMLDDGQRNTIRTLAVSLVELGSILREANKPDSVAVYEEAIPLCQLINDKHIEATIAFNLGKAYGGVSIPAVRDLAQAERWYRRSLELHDEGDRLARGRCLSQLGIIAHIRFNEAQSAQVSESDLLGHLNVAVELYRRAIELTPPNAAHDLAATYHQLGIIYYDAGDLDRALPLYREAMRYSEAAGDLYHAAVIRRNVAKALAQNGRLADAMDYARAALRGYSTFGEQAAEELKHTQDFIQEIQNRLRMAEGKR